MYFKLIEMEINQYQLHSLIMYDKIWQNFFVIIDIFVKEQNKNSWFLKIIYFRNNVI